MRIFLLTVGATCVQSRVRPCDCVCRSRWLGRKFHNSSRGEPYAAKFGAVDDVIGCVSMYLYGVVDAVGVCVSVSLSLSLSLSVYVCVASLSVALSVSLSPSLERARVRALSVFRAFVRALCHFRSPTLALSPLHTI